MLNSLAALPHRVEFGAALLCWRSLPGGQMHRLAKPIPTGLRRERSAERRNGEYISVMTQRITPIE